MHLGNTSLRLHLDYALSTTIPPRRRTAETSNRRRCCVSFHARTHARSHTYSTHTYTRTHSLKLGRVGSRSCARELFRRPPWLEAILDELSSHVSQADGATRTLVAIYTPEVRELTDASSTRSHLLGRSQTSHAPLMYCSNSCFRQSAPTS